MAYDSQRARTVLFGGLVNGGSSPILLGDTWEWDGNAWQSIAVATAPPGRVAHAMAYDSQRHRTVVFGGSSIGSFFGDTWEWDGIAWTQVAGNGPSPRSACRMAYDTQRARTVLFGGQGTLTSFDGDTWEWNGSTWMQAANTGPSARRFTAIAYDSQRSRTVLFGGQDSSGIVGDTWEWDGSTWTRVASAGPPPRWHHALAYDSFRGRTVMFGGETGTPALGDTWEWNGSAWTQMASGGLSGRIDHTMAYDAQREQVLLFSETETWARRGGIDATASTFGSGCGSPALALNPVNRPVIATAAQLALNNVPSSLAAVLIGLSNTSFPPHSLPLSLGPFGLTGCELLVSIDAAAPAQSTGQGTASFSIPLPHLAALTGQVVFLQAWAAPGVNAAGIVMSNGVRWEIGNN